VDRRGKQRGGEGRRGEERGGEGRSYCHQHLDSSPAELTMDF
jgi:hypothetical protein